MKSKQLLGGVLIVLAVISLALCQNKMTKTFRKNPTDEILKKYNQENKVDILLLDMDYDEKTDKYKHQYQVIYQPLDNKDTLITETTAWLDVSDSYFNEHVNDMGMVLVSKKDAVTIEKKVSPPGYNDYIGNEKYGSWNNNNGSSFWQFYGQYHFMTSMFYMMSPVRYSYWNDYRTNYYPRGRSYYGTYNGSSRYGTNGTSTKSRSTSSKWSSKPSSFKQNVRSRVSRSSSRVNRSTGRSNSSFRSRGGGYGK